MRTLQRAAKGYHLVLNGCQNAVPTLAELFLVIAGFQFAIKSCIHTQHTIANFSINFINFECICKNLDEKFGL